MQSQISAKKVVFTIIGLLLLVGWVGSKIDTSSPEASASAATPAAAAQSSDAERGYELSMEASRLLEAAQAESIEASQASTVAEVCSHLPSLQSKVARVDEIIAELHTLDLNSESADALQVVDDTFAPVHEAMPLLESTC